jgi:hypothetical protein
MFTSVKMSIVLFWFVSPEDGGETCLRNVSEHLQHCNNRLTEACTRLAAKSLSVCRYWWWSLSIIPWWQISEHSTADAKQLRAWETSRKEGKTDGKSKRGARLSTVYLSMYSITGNIYCSQLSSVAILLQHEPNCFTSYNTRKWLCFLSLCAIVFRSPPASHVSSSNGRWSSRFASTIIVPGMGPAVGRGRGKGVWVSVNESSFRKSRAHQVGPVLIVEYVS